MDAEREIKRTSQTVLCGDSRKLIKQYLEPEIFSLYLADPVYQWHWQYKWCAAIAKIVLKPMGNLLLWYGGNKEHIIQKYAMQHMEYCWHFHYTVVAKTSGNMGAYRVRLWTTPLYWFRKYGSRATPKKTVIDTYISRAAPSGKFRWQKNLGVIAYYLCAFTEEGDWVLDTMAGEGSVGVVCKQFHRNYIGMEIDPKRADTAQKRIDDTQEMALLVDVTQPELSFGKDIENGIEDSDQEAGAPESARIAEEKSP